ncbi:hypothetical protein ACFLSQ_07580 [Bacteroidota bacterium]
MNKRILNIISALLIVMILPASTGVSVFHHICGMEGTHSVSLYSESTCSAHHEEACACCEDAENNNTCSIDNHDHCLEYVEYISIDSDFISIDKQKNQLAKFELSYESQINSVVSDLFGKQSDISYLKRDIKIPARQNISHIHLKSQYKNSEKPSDSFIA